MRLPSLALVVLFPALASCTSVERVNLAPYLTGSEIQLSEGHAPADAQPVGIIAVETSGWYLLGLMPIVRVDMENCLDRMVEEAKRLGADGISNLQASYDPASMLNLLSIGLPDWTATINMTGMAYQLPERRPPVLYRAVPPN